ncbi:MAG: VOC family protein [Mesonia sp.]|tara:strand:- start:36067 stop:36432 length:366 start_codon:yes stop_codon:yes gene_type:complete
MKAIETISIPVTNQENAKKFYIDKLNFEVVFEGSSPDGNKWLQLAIPNDKTSITLVKGPEHAKSGSVKGTIISTDDIEADQKYLKSKGVKLAPIQEMPFGKITSFSDPDGNEWVLRQAANW